MHKTTIRLNPEAHEKAIANADALGLSLNEYINQLIEGTTSEDKPKRVRGAKADLMLATAQRVMTKTEGILKRHKIYYVVSDGALWLLSKTANGNQRVMDRLCDISPLVTDTHLDQVEKLLNRADIEAAVMALDTLGIMLTADWFKKLSTGQQREMLYNVLVDGWNLEEVLHKVTTKEAICIPSHAPSLVTRVFANIGTTLDNLLHNQQVEYRSYA